MKKCLATLMLATMLLATGCGNNAMDGAKKDAQEAAAKVEQKVDEAKSDAAAKVDEAKSKADEAKDVATAKVDEAKDAATAKVDEAKDAAQSAMDDAAQKLDDVTADVNGRMVALGGLVPGSTTLDDVQAMFGEATAVDGKVMTFVNGLKVTLDDANKVKEISTTGADFDTPEGIYVGASEYALNDYCGPADAIRQIANGAEYEYNSGDKKSKVIYTAQNGVISEIKCSLNN
ncbi:MAG: hypothetical protein SR1Q7_08855 [Quinella sp. 1Q7]|nr:hypothetical protein [Quinella sp. 1Q7]